MKICEMCNRVRKSFYRNSLCCTECHEELKAQERREAADMEAFRCKECGWAVPWDQRMLEPTPETGTYVCRHCQYLTKTLIRYPGVEAEEEWFEREERQYDEWERLERKLIWD